MNGNWTTCCLSQRDLCVREACHRMERPPRTFPAIRHEACLEQAGQGRTAQCKEVSTAIKRDTQPSSTLNTETKGSCQRLVTICILAAVKNFRSHAFLLTNSASTTRRFDPPRDTIPSQLQPPPILITCLLNTHANATQSSN